MTMGGMITTMLEMNASQWMSQFNKVMGMATAGGKAIDGALTNVGQGAERAGKGVEGLGGATENTTKKTTALSQAQAQSAITSGSYVKALAEQNRQMVSANRFGGQYINTINQMSPKLGAIEQMITKNGTAFEKLMANASKMGYQVVGPITSIESALQTLPPAINSNTGAMNSFANSFKSSVGGMVSNWSNFVSGFADFGIFMGGMLGMAVGKFTIGNALAREEAKSTFAFMKMGKQDIDSLSKSMEDYALKASKISVDEINTGMSKIYSSHKMGIADMKSGIPVVGDFMAKFKSEGRTAQEAVLAINDAMDGQFRRMQELGIKKEDLVDKGWDPKKPQTFFTALNAIFKDRGWDGWAMKMNSTADKIDMLKEKLEKAGADIGMAMLPVLSLIVDGFLAITNVLGGPLTGALIVLPAMAVMLGFLFEPIKNVIGGIGYVKEGILGLTGPTSRLGMVARGSNVSWIDWGNNMQLTQGRMAGVTKNSKGLIGSLKALTLAQIATGVALGALVLAFVALYAVMSKYGDNAGRFEKATDQAGQYVEVLKKRKENLNTTIANLNKTRSDEIAKGHDVSQIDAEIKTKKEELDTATKNLDDTEATYTKNKEARKALEGQWVGVTQSGAEKELEIKRKTGQISEATYQKQKDDLTNMGALNTDYANTISAVSRGYDKANGTILKLSKGQSGYAKQMRKDPEYFKNYSQTYWDWAESMDKANQAWTKGDYLTWFIEGWRGMLDHFKLLCMEFETATIAWWNSWSIAGKLEQYISKPFMDWWSSWSIGGWWNSWSILEILGLDDINVADEMYKTIEKPITDWWNGWTMIDLGRKLKVPESTLKFFQKLYCIIMGCSPGVVPALKKLFDVWNNVWNKITGSIGSIIGRIIGFLQQVYTTITTRLTNTWNRAKTIVSNGVTAVVNFFMKLPSNFLKGLQIIYTYVISKLTSTFNWAKAYVRASVSSLGSAFWSLVSPAKKAWNSVYSAVSGPISKILGLVSNLRSALGLGGGSFRNMTSSIGKAVSNVFAGPGDTTITGDIGAGPGPDDGGLLEALKFVPQEWSNPILSMANGMFMNYTGPATTGNDIFKADDPNCCAGAGAGPFDGVASAWPSKIMGSVNKMASNYFGVGSFNPNNLGGLFKSFISKLFSGFHYEFYYGMHKGPGGTMADRGGNCMDMASLVCAVANAFGFNCSMGRNFWNGIPHRFATIAGLGNFDPTNWVKNRSWAPGGGGRPRTTFGSIGMGAGPGDGSGSGKQVIVRKEFIFHVNGLPEFEKQVKKILDKETCIY